jgi:hypothetical protein
MYFNYEWMILMNIWMTSNEWISFIHFLIVFVYTIYMYYGKIYV